MLNELLVGFTDLVTGQAPLFVVDRPEVSSTVAVVALEVTKQAASILCDLAACNGAVAAYKRLDFVCFCLLDWHRN